MKDGESSSNNVNPERGRATAAWRLTWPVLPLIIIYVATQILDLPLLPRWKVNIDGNTGSATAVQGFGGRLDLGPGSPEKGQWWVGTSSGETVTTRWSKLIQDVEWAGKRAVAILLFLLLACWARWPWESTFPGVQRRYFGLVLAVGFGACAGIMYGAHWIHFLLTGSYLDLGQVSKRSPLLYGTFSMFIEFYGPFILAPIAEEVLFRGWLQRILTPICKVWPALLLQAVAFGAVHYDAQGINGVFLTGALGVLLGAVFLYSGKLWPGILCHSLANIYGHSNDLWWIWNGRPE